MEEGTQSDATVTDRDCFLSLPRHETVCRIFQNGGQWLGKTLPGPTLTYLLVTRALVHEDGRRNHDAPFDFLRCRSSRGDKSDLPIPHKDTEPYESKRLKQ